ncbi:MAG TPA: RNA polymerase sigma factor [Steroidobacteraceae bacterium]|nr:RNA polymerase sigma factor [Steroidobacteraceae bacterium]
MTSAITSAPMLPEQNRAITDAVGREKARLKAFIRRRVFDESEAEDILQDVLYELVLAYRQLQPLEEIGAWLFRVARNRIIDLFRRKRPLLPDRLDASGAGDVPADAPGEDCVLDELLLPATQTPEAMLARELLLKQLATAIDALPAEQRAVFIAHELEGASFREMAARTGVPLNTLLARKHYAMRQLRRSLQGTYDEWFD